ncbi:MAG: 2Fe-2S iron-sulfur cluster-binding protein [Candidatus Promineifilaceae bacterium]
MSESDKKYRVLLKNLDVTLLVGEDEPIYDAALAVGIQLPIACRYGGCITCAAKMLSGKVRQPNATALNRRQSKAGYILLCVARPQADCVLEVGVDSHDELYVNPFAIKPSS